MYIIQGIILGNVKMRRFFFFLHWVLRYMHCAFVVMKKIYIAWSINSTVFHNNFNSGLPHCSLIEFGYCSSVIICHQVEATLWTDGYYLRSFWLLSGPREDTSAPSRGYCDAQFVGTFVKPISLTSFPYILQHNDQKVFHSL